eukprot:5890342-Pyramimonas_sp.AAC.1
MLSSWASSSSSSRRLVAVGWRSHLLMITECCELFNRCALREAVVFGLVLPRTRDMPRKSTTLSG